ncbi:MAG: hypothetical protein GQ569_03000 [Methylococcaceae bacterium]|nr:hypothetical protein [Methylococcaceae bacterium]
MIKRSLKRYAFYGVLLSLNGLTGCAVFNEIFEYESTAEYVESVFKRQNAISTQVMMLSGTELEADEYEELLQAEAKMQQDCKLLNDYAVKEMDRESTSLLFKKQVKDSAEGCDLSIEEVESLLEDFDLD